MYREVEVSARLHFQATSCNPHTFTVRTPVLAPFDSFALNAPLEGV